MIGLLQDEAKLDAVVSKSTSVVIVNFNSGSYLCRAVESALQQPETAEVVVVDNCSSDDSVRQLQEQYSLPNVCLVESETNYGFAHACNVGVTKATGEYILFLNPDCKLSENALQLMLAVFDEEENAGMVGPLLINPDGTEQRGARRDIPNPWQIFCVALQFHRLMPNHPRFRSFNHVGRPLPKKPAVVPAISGACMLVPRRAIEKVGTMDRAFFLHFEDLDWCLRFQSAGMHVVFVPQAVVEHTQGVCGRGRPIRVEYHKHKSLIAFLKKHFAAFYPSSFMAIVYGVVFLRFFGATLKVLFRRQPTLP